MMRLLDLFCGAGGAALGYSAAGFDEIVGVDIVPQPHYPFDFVQGDALSPPVDLSLFDVIHASPPCQAYTNFVRAGLTGTSDYPELIGPVRGLLESSGRRWVIENVPSSGLEGMTLCGSMFGLRNLRRHRRFASSELLMPPGPCRHDLDEGIVGVYGSGGATNPGGHGRRYRNREEAVEVMGLPPDIAWTLKMITESIPPAYTDHIGRFLLGVS